MSLCPDIYFPHVSSPLVGICFCISSLMQSRVSTSPIEGPRRRPAWRGWRWCPPSEAPSRWRPGHSRMPWSMLDNASMFHFPDRTHQLNSPTQCITCVFTLYSANSVVVYRTSVLHIFSQCQRASHRRFAQENVDHTPGWGYQPTGEKPASSSRASRDPPPLPEIYPPKSTWKLFEVFLFLTF